MCDGATASDSLLRLASQTRRWAVRAPFHAPTHHASPLVMLSGHTNAGVSPGGGPAGDRHGASHRPTAADGRRPAAAGAGGWAAACGGGLHVFLDSE